MSNISLNQNRRLNNDLDKNIHIYIYIYIYIYKSQRNKANTTSEKRYAKTYEIETRTNIAYRNHAWNQASSYGRLTIIL